jgi:acetyl esterase/lipase
MNFAPKGVGEALLAFVLRGRSNCCSSPCFRRAARSGSSGAGWPACRRSPIGTRGVGVTAGTVGGVPGEWSRRAGAPARPGSILYLHGGAYCVGSPATHRALTSRLARVTGLPVFAADYRLAPEHPFPAGLDDARAAYRALRADGPVILMGDSAGGGLALATALALRDAGAPPRRRWCCSRPGWTWPRRATAPARAAGRGHAGLGLDGSLRPPLCGRRGRLRSATADAPGGVRPAPLVSPLHADLRGLPPVLIQAGTDELLHPQALALHDALQAAGVDVRCEITQRRWHVFQLHANACPAPTPPSTAWRAVLGAAGRRCAAHSEHQVVILGAGMSGLCMAIGLQRAGIHDFVIVEKQPGLGGTWWDNTYPGAHVDVPSPVYSFSFAPNPDWSRRFASAPEIQAYMQQLAEQARPAGPHAPRHAAHRGHVR